MATTVWDGIINTANANADQVISFLTNNWNWAAIEDADYQGKRFYINSAKTVGLEFYARTGTNDYGFRIYYNSSAHNQELISNNIAAKIEVVSNKALIISCKSGTTFSGNVRKYIVCNGLNSQTNNIEQIIIYALAETDNFMNTIYASDNRAASLEYDRTQSAMCNAKFTELINFYCKDTKFVATNVYKALLIDLSAWSYGDVMINGHLYRMSGPVFVLDE